MKTKVFFLPLSPGPSPARGEGSSLPCLFGTLTMILVVAISCSVPFHVSILDQQ